MSEPRAESAERAPHDRPPKLFYVTVEAFRVDPDDDLHVHVGPPYSKREYAENDAEMDRDITEEYEEEHGETPYAEHHVSVHELAVSDHAIENAEREDEESHRITMEAADAVAASMLADEGIGPLAGDDDE